MLSDKEIDAVADRIVAKMMDGSGKAMRMLIKDEAEPLINKKVEEAREEAKKEMDAHIDACPFKKQFNKIILRVALYMAGAVMGANMIGIPVMKKIYSFIAGIV